MQVLVWDARNGAALTEVITDTGRKFFHLISTYTRTSVTIDGQGTIGSIQNHDIAWVNPMGIFDSIAIDIPDIRPFPRILKKYRRYIPQRVTFNYDMAIGRIWAQLDNIGMSQDRE
jgi:hypothetical protein